MIPSPSLAVDGPVTDWPNRHMSPSRRVDVNGTTLYVEDAGGSNSAIVFSHGLLLSTRMWDRQVAALRSRYRCIAYDHRGQGQSAVPNTRSIDMDV